MTIRSMIAGFVSNLIDPPRRSATVSDRAAMRLSVAETEDTITHGQRYGSSDRENTDRLTTIDQALKACRTNPIAKTIRELQTNFAIGDGLGFESEEPKTKASIDDIWNHPLNDLDTQIEEFANETWVTGDLFILGSVETATARTYYRVLPAEMVSTIKTAENDYRQEQEYKSSEFDDKPFLAYDSNKNYIEGGEFILHFPLNRVAGQCFGTSDYDTILYWIRLYRQFIEDRARLNFFRQLFTFIVQRAFDSETEKGLYVKKFADRLPKKSGGVLAIDEGENVGTINPNLGSFEAGEDGMLLVRMIAIGVDFPLHWLGFAESNTRTTAEAAGTPAFRRLRARQKFIIQAITRMIQVALEIKKKADPNSLPDKPEFTITAPDLTERDNEKLGLAVLRVMQAFAPLYNSGKVSVTELMRLVYRFVGETRPKDEPNADKPIVLSGGKNNTDPAPPTDPTPTAQ